MPDTHTITLPIPDNCLGQTRGNWQKKARISKQMRNDAALLAVSLRPLKFRPRALIHYGFYWPDYTQRDEANYIHNCKPYVDGLVDAGLIPGDHWRVLSTDGAHSELD